MARANYFSKDWKSRKLRLHRPVWSRGLPRTNRDAWDRVPHVVQSLSRCKDKIPIVHLPEKGGKTTISQYNSFLFSFTGPALKGDYFTRTQLTQERGKPESPLFPFHWHSKYQLLHQLQLGGGASGRAKLKHTKGFYPFISTSPHHCQISKASV